MKPFDGTTPRSSGYITEDRQPLQGAVIDFSMGWAGPFVYPHTGDIGADVVKIEAIQYSDW
ncbi:hypothetical protein LMTR3_21055 [Bradyrhizobium sp. LMTR 3]|nr:hypothetical protein LMTR3_21055 [Bradyrhizobium sp. LMTR 3]